MELHHIRYFVAIAEELNFTKAAQKLFVTQSALSQQIAALEKEFGVKLFVRSQKGLQLSEAGRTFYRDAKQILSLTDRSIDRMRTYALENASSRRLVIVVTPMDNTLERIGFAEAFSSWRAENPQVDTEFKRTSEQIALNLLDKDEVDVAIMNISSWADVARLDYHSMTLCKDEMCIVVSRNFFTEATVSQLTRGNRNIHFVLAQGDHRWNEHIRANILNPTGLRYTTSYQKNYFTALDSVRMTGSAVVTFKGCPSVLSSRDLYSISTGLPAANVYTVAIFKRQSEEVDRFLSMLCSSCYARSDGEAEAIPGEVPGGAK